MLRRSPRRTPALLAANRANALKSTGPRTPRGRERSSCNAFRNGSRASLRFWLRALPLLELAEFLALRAALDRALLMAGVALRASLIPAQRAARVDVASTLREE